MTNETKEMLKKIYESALQCVNAQGYTAIDPGFVELSMKQQIPDLIRRGIEYSDDVIEGFSLLEDIERAFAKATERRRKEAFALFRAAARGEKTYEDLKKAIELAQEFHREAYAIEVFLSSLSEAVASKGHMTCRGIK